MAVVQVARARVLPCIPDSGQSRNDASMVKQSSSYFFLIPFLWHVPYLNDLQALPFFPSIKVWVLECAPIQFFFSYLCSALLIMSNSDWFLCFFMLDASK